MKIAVTSQNFRTVTPHAGRTRRFLVYAVEPGGEPVEVERLDLPKEQALHEFHGGGAHPLDAVDVLIAGSFGEGFVRRMAKRGIVAMRTDATDPLEAVRTYVEAARAGPVAQTILERLQGGPSSDRARGHRHRCGHGHARGAGLARRAQEDIL